MRSSTECWLNGRWTWLCFENRIVSKTLSFAFLTIATSGMTFVALYQRQVTVSNAQGCSVSVVVAHVSQRNMCM